jgi:hypothetical protein
MSLAEQERQSPTHHNDVIPLIIQRLTKSDDWFLTHSLTHKLTCYSQSCYALFVDGARIEDGTPRGTTGSTGNRQQATGNGE